MADENLQSPTKIYKILKKFVGHGKYKYCETQVGEYYSIKALKMMGFDDRRIRDLEDTKCILSEKSKEYVTAVDLKDWLNNSEKEIEPNSKTPRPDEDDSNTIPEMRISLYYETSHLPKFSILDSGIKLFGKEYQIYKKALWYQLVGLKLKRPIHYKSIRTDSRFNMLACLPSGHGKKNLKLGQRKITELINHTVQEPTSLHPEQLVGKVVERSKKVKNSNTGKYQTVKEYIPNRGYFDADLIQLDESIELLRSKDPKVVETRSYICVAADPIGDNEIKKKLVEHLENEVLKYHPECTFTFFFQPQMIDKEALTCGLIRRFMVIYNIPNQEVRTVFNKRLRDSDDYHDNWKEFANYLQTITSDDLTFDSDCEELFEDYASYLVEVGSMLNEKSYNYTKIMSQTLLDFLIKLSYIVAAGMGSTQVSKKHIELAYHDLFEFYLSSCSYVNSKILGAIDYGDTWGLSDYKGIRCLKYLHSNGFVDESSACSVNQFVNVIAEIYDYSISSNWKGSQAHKRYRKWKDAGLVNSKQVGQYDSCVWLARDVDSNKFEGVQDSKGVIEYNRIKSLIIKGKYTNNIILPLLPSNRVYSINSNPNSTFRVSHPSNPSNPKGDNTLDKPTILNILQQRQQVNGNKPVSTGELASFAGKSQETVFEELTRLRRIGEVLENPKDFWQVIP